MPRIRDIPVGIHQVDTLSSSEVETDTTSLQTDQKDFAAWVVLRRLHGPSAFVPFHGTIETVVSNVGHLERILNSDERSVKQSVDIEMT